jgi:hypothetical protein
LKDVLWCNLGHDIPNPATRPKRKKNAGPGRTKSPTSTGGGAGGGSDDGADEEQHDTGKVVTTVLDAMVPFVLVWVGGCYR